MLNHLKKLLNIQKTQKSIYSIVGEESGTYELVKNFYEIMENDPKAKDCLDVHELKEGKVPDEVKKKLFMFLCGWFGGPNLFIESYGPPKMKARHIHVKIGEKEKEQWLHCINKAIKKHSHKIKKKDYKIISNSFWALATRIKNTD